MRGFARLIQRVYAVLLALYPKDFRDEFGNEMRAVLAALVDETARRGAWQLAAACLRELRDLPGAILHEHRRTRRNRAVSKQPLWAPESGSWREFLFALAPFLLLGVLPPLLSLLQVPYVHTPVAGNVAFAFLGLLLCLCIIGLAKGLPRWSWPYLGIVLAAVSVYALRGPMSGLYHTFVSRSDPWFVRQVAYQGQCWGGMLIVTVVIVVAAAALPVLRPLYVRLRRDWTLLSFGLYGGALLALVLTLDDYVREEPYQLAAMMILVAGGWMYLRVHHLWQRALILSAAFTLAMGVAAIGKAILFASADWPYPRFSFTPRTEAVSTVIMWAWLMVAILVPALLNLLPDPERRMGTATR